MFDKLMRLHSFTRCMLTRGLLAGAAQLFFCSSKGKAGRLSSPCKCFEKKNPHSGSFATSVATQCPARNLFPAAPSSLYFHSFRSSAWKSLHLDVLGWFFSPKPVLKKQPSCSKEPLGFFFSLPSGFPGAAARRDKRSSRQANKDAC